MPLVVDVRRRNAQGHDGWVESGRLGPGLSGSVSDNKPDGGRDVYEFECSPDGREGILRRSRAGIDVTVGPARSILTTALEEVSRISGGAYYLLQVKTDISPEPRVLRFRMVYDHTEGADAIHQ